MGGAADVEQQAATWLAKRESDSWSEADEASFQAWKSASTAHRLALLRLESAWRRSDKLALSSRLRAEGAALLRGGRPIGQPRRIATSLRHALLPLTAAIALVFGVSLFATGGQSYATEVGGFEKLPLPDGSRVDLNTDTKLDIALDGRERRVNLSRGEAFFEVARDTSRPFIVRAGAYRVVGTGTAFSIRLNGEALNVAVTQGRVRIECDGIYGASFVQAGQVAMAADGGARVLSVAADQIDRMLSWREGLLVFRNSRLDAVAGEFNRYNRRRLRVAPSVADVRIDGTFKASNLDGFLRLLHRGFAVKARPAGAEELLLERAR
jgi:transmembrane sensor